MLNVHYSTQFKKDFKTCVKRGYKMPLLIYRQTDTELKLGRTGTHSDLFGE